MINPKELRLGNYINVIGGNVKISHLKTEHFTFIVGKDNTGLDVFNPYLPYTDDRVKPIQLTEEMLLKCSLNGDEIELWNRVCVNEYEYYDRYVFYNAIDGISNLEIHVVVSNYGDEIHKQFILSIDKDERQGGEIDQLHKFQNGVYWVTNGKELEIKL